MGEGDHRRNDRGGFGTPCQAVRNGSVDLDLVERKTRQLAQRRIAGAEIVERDRHADLPELMQHRQVLGLIFEQHGLGDIELQSLRRQVRVGQCT